MITTLISDFSRVVIFPRDTSYTGELNALHDSLILEDAHYDFDRYFRFNEDLLQYYKKLSTLLTIAMFTSGKLQEYPQADARLRGVFAHIFSASDMHISKSDPDAYPVLLKQLGVRAEECIFVDDDSRNIAAAQSAGLHAIQYVSLPALIPRV